MTPNHDTLPHPSCLRTLVPYYGDEKLDAVASVCVGEYTLLICKYGNYYKVVYAPVGKAISDGWATIDAAVSAIISLQDKLLSNIPRRLREMEESYQPLLAPENGIQVYDWQWRELQRFASGEYRAVPEIDVAGIGGLPYPPEHHLHLSIAADGDDFVAYTPSDTHGWRDRQVRLRYGKYLKKTFPTMTDSQVQAAVTALRTKLALETSPATLHFTTDRETINKVFETPLCPRDSNTVSCMCGKWSTADTRPYHVYADSPDVAVAYVREHGEIVARSVVSTKDKSYVRPYARGGEAVLCEALETMLEELGYVEDELTGNRLTVLEPDRNCDPTLPYIDNGGQCVRREGRYWLVVGNHDDPDYECSNTDGTADRITPQCERCERDEDDCECMYCECCAENYYPHCENCSLCEHCDGCIEHDGCSCERCTNCYQTVEHDCRCSRCDECSELTRDCECEEEEEQDEVEDEEVTVVTAVASIAVTPTR